MSSTIECKPRPENSKARALRRQGLIPAVLYGHNGAESVSLTIDEKEALILLREASVNNTLVDVKVPDISWQGKALIREVQAHPWRRTLYHISFFSVAAQDSLEVVAPINLIGEAEGSKEGGILEQNLTELKIQCDPQHIPESIDIDVTDMTIGTNVLVKELVLPQGVAAVDDPETTVLSIVPPPTREEEETTEPTVEDVLGISLEEEVTPEKDTETPES